uniref:Uncharacterized protein n=1 Tax=Timema shepardi TaxID=629360 RepID=A0A7R9ALY5_TIMSH|nr:unnamed protein product [Timema shepardi]
MYSWVRRRGAGVGLELHPVSSTAAILELGHVEWAVQQAGFKRVKRGYKPLRVENLVRNMRPQEDPSDPYFPFQWYLKNTGQNGGKAKLDLNVEAAWAQGVTGKNVTTAIMDDDKGVIWVRGRGTLFVYGGVAIGKKVWGEITLTQSQGSLGALI